MCFVCISVPPHALSLAHCVRFGTLRFGKLENDDGSCTGRFWWSGGMCECAEGGDMQDKIKHRGQMLTFAHKSIASSRCLLAVCVCFFFFD